MNGERDNVENEMMCVCIVCVRQKGGCEIAQIDRSEKHFLDADFDHL